MPAAASAAFTAASIFAAVDFTGYPGVTCTATVPSFSVTDCTAFKSAKGLPQTGSATASTTLRISSKFILLIQ